MDGGYRCLDRLHPRLQYQRRFLLGPFTLLFLPGWLQLFATFSPLTTVTLNWRINRICYLQRPLAIFLQEVLDLF